ncbi:MAG: 30S ribosomal protein S16 [Candidatus Nealsonbacteria bacterium RIFOXYB1_FULL_40_15]|uniref:Small ribosomal subunit protein bS16 n=2 Tax=Candidatus Nealsoniibacteriota TaxID=1817911 RepID=A0A1G2EUE3_9BACT|nr:MAG: 30S ribosomal protein S16 [Candidatus Nealsonbacteria bacterium RIFOXYB1_FULL_40_15]OGZ28888.1 MAG: 30S ribosomal protein S16 [Candidatus Nealsonbacteria bacterium RIFOXYC1_FULL_40_7]OGZ29564.1 MAG: 30S ribosomal protein S16 [Candidatus Nealsonbacteria bacterium RIFOXYD1_FULL_39_11]
MLEIRLLRIGRKNQPSYKVVVTDRRNAPKGGRFVDEVGSWNPLTKKRILDQEKIKSWISKGAKASDTVHNMLVEEKIVKGEKIESHKKSKKEQPASQDSGKKESPANDQPKETPEKSEEKKD